MSEKTPANDALAQQVDGSNAGIANIERTFLRLTFWQTLLSLAGVFTGAVALYAALSESQAVREQTAASVWPYVEMMIEDTDDGENARFALAVENVGVGPARMQGVEFRVDGEAIPSWDVLTARLLEDPVKVGVDFGRSTISNRVIAPGQRISAFQTVDRELALRMQEVVYGGRASLRYCYCSIFSECWLSQLLPGEGVEGGVEPVAGCPDFGADRFRD